MQTLESRHRCSACKHGFKASKPTKRKVLVPVTAGSTHPHCVLLLTCLDHLPACLIDLLDLPVWGEVSWQLGDGLTHRLEHTDVHTWGGGVEGTGVDF